MRTALIIFLILTATLSCSKRRTAARAPAAPARVAAAVPPVPRPLTPLEAADGFFDRGDLVNAATAYESLRADGASLPETTAFRLAIIYLNPSGPAANPARARELLTDLARKSPASAYGRHAALLLDLLAQQSEAQQLKTDLRVRDERVKALASELDRLKRLEQERTKRPRPRK